MARILKKEVKTPFFHIMVQGINRENIFNCERDIERFFRIIGETKEKIDIIILAYCIMSNHAHLLIYEEDVEKMSKFMHLVNLNYAKFYNYKYDRVGYVFRDRYKMQLISSEKHLYTCIRYIHNNPVKANICSHPKEYKYSSYQTNIFYTDKNKKLEIDKIIAENIYQEEQNSKFEFLEIREIELTALEKKEECGKVVKKFIKENDISLTDLKKDKNLLKDAVKNWKKEFGFSYDAIANEIGICRSTLRKWLQ